MTGCRLCGAPTSRRLCQDCERDEYWTEQARQRDPEDDEGWTVTQQGLDGERASDCQARLDGGIVKPGGGDES